MRSQWRNISSSQKWIKVTACIEALPLCRMHVYTQVRASGFELPPHNTTPRIWLLNKGVSKPWNPQTEKPTQGLYPMFLRSIVNWRLLVFSNSFMWMDEARHLPGSAHICMQIRDFMTHMALEPVIPLRLQLYTGQSRNLPEVSTSPVPAFKNEVTTTI